MHEHNYFMVLNIDENCNPRPAVSAAVEPMLDLDIFRTVEETLLSRVCPNTSGTNAEGGLSSCAYGTFQGAICTTSYPDQKGP